MIEVALYLKNLPGRIKMWAMVAEIYVANYGLLKGLKRFYDALIETTETMTRQDRS